MFVDEVDIEIKAGDGSDGIVHFLANRHQPKGGPDGGDGGQGGSVWAESVADITRLKVFRQSKKYEAEKGGLGGPRQKTGANGADLILKVPVGTVITYDNGTSLEFTRVGERQMLAKGGLGGFGNYHFRSPANTTPQFAKPGEKKSWKRLHLELKLIAQIGLIGLPNAGKTSLLNALTQAHAKVANYPFTTLEPNLGVTNHGFIIADIPGLIEGAALGKGLGSRFLRHVERTGLLVHCVSAESADIKRDYDTIRAEITNFSSRLAAKPELVLITKSDLVEETTLKSLKQQLPQVKLAVSIIDDSTLQQLNSLFLESLKLS
ncbi:GTPase ObgE [Patescibacteria group bacterium]|nr:GTPase ObgE [Patescibacteria group bacterium]